MIMGVTGSGKTTVGEALARRLGWEFADADDFHSVANKRKIHEGVALTDADREPWLRALHERVEEWVLSRRDAVLRSVRPGLAASLGYSSGCLCIGGPA